MTTTKSLIQQANYQIPGYREAEAAFETAKGWNPLSLVAPDSHEALRSDMYTAAYAGKDMPADLLIRLSHAAQIEQSQERVRHFISTVRDDMKAQLEQVKRAGADGALTWLDQQMSNLKSAVCKDADLLEGARSADQAIEIGPKAIKAWTRIQEAVGQYDEIRTAQSALTEASFDKHDWNTPDGGLQGILAFAYCGHLADAIHRESYWIDVREETRRTQTRIGLTDSLGAGDWIKWLDNAPGTPWPQMGRTDHWPTANRTDYLLWVMTEANPWVPTIPQLTAALTVSTIATSRPIEEPGAGTGAPSVEMRLASINQALTDLEAITGVDRAGNPTGKPRVDGNPTSSRSFTHGSDAQPIYN